MAVTKIRKISSWVLILCTVISLVVLGVFFLGGDDAPLKEDLWTPTYTGLFLYWMYILLAITAFATLGFGIWQFATSFKDNPKGGLAGLIVIVLFAGLLYITYAIGNPEPLTTIINTEALAYNVPFWLKVSDMWIYSTYILLGLVVIAILGGSIKKMLDR